MKVCMFHQREIELICETCLLFICPSCLFDHHSTHTIESIQAAIANSNLLFNDRAEFISGAYNKLSKLHCIIEEGIKIKRRLIDDYYEGRIEALRKEHDAAKKKFDEILKLVEIPKLQSFEIYDPGAKSVIDIQKWARNCSEFLKIQISDENILAVLKILKTDDFSYRKQFLEGYFEKRTRASHKELIDSILICLPEITVHRPFDVVIETNPDIRSKVMKRNGLRNKDIYSPNVEVNCEYLFEKEKLIEKKTKMLNISPYTIDEKRDIMWNFEEIFDFPLNIKLQLDHDINFLRPRADEILTFDLHIHNKSAKSTQFQLELISIIKNLKFMQSFSLLVETLDYDVFFANLGSSFQFTRKLQKFFLQSLYHLSKAHVSDFLNKMSEYLRLTSLQLRVCLDEPEVIQSLESVVSVNKYSLKTLELMNPFTANIGMPLMIYNVFPYLYPNCRLNNLAIDLKFCLTEPLLKEISRVVMFNPIIQFSLTFNLLDHEANEFFEPLWLALEMKEELFSILIENGNTFNNYAYADYNLPMLLSSLKKKKLARLALRMHNGNTGDLSKDINIKKFLLEKGNYFLGLRILKINFGESNIETYFEQYLMLFKSCTKLDYSKLKIFGAILDLHNLVSTFQKHHPKCKESRLELPNIVLNLEETTKSLQKYFKDVTVETDRSFLSLYCSDDLTLRVIQLDN